MKIADITLARLPNTQIGFSGDGFHIVAKAGSRGGWAQIFDAQTGELRRTLDQEFESLVVRGDHYILICPGRDRHQKDLRIFRIDSGLQVMDRFPKRNHLPWKTWAQSGSGALLAIADPERTRLLNITEESESPLQFTFEDPPSLLRFFKDKWLFASGQHEWNLKDLNSGELLMSDRQSARALFWSRDGRYVAVCRGQVQFWDTQAGEMVAQSFFPASTVTFSPDSKYVALSSGANRSRNRDGWWDSGKFIVIRTEDWSQVGEEFNHSGFPVRFSEDSSYFFAYSNSKERDEPVKVHHTLFTTEGMKSKSGTRNGVSASLAATGHVALNVFSVDSYGRWIEIWAPGLKSKSRQVAATLIKFHPFDGRYLAIKGEEVGLWTLERPIAEPPASSERSEAKPEPKPKPQPKQEPETFQSAAPDLPAKPAQYSGLVFQLSRAPGARATMLAVGKPLKLLYQNRIPRVEQPGFLFGSKLERLAYPYDIEMAADKEFTLAAWVKPTEYREQRGREKGHVILSRYHGGREGSFILQLPAKGGQNEGCLHLTLCNNKILNRPVTCWCKDKLPLNTWTHVAVTFSRGRVVFFINSELKLEETLPLQSTTPNHYRQDHIHIGGHREGAHDMMRFTGGINDTRLYNVALEPKEIERIYYDTRAVHRLDETIK